MLPWIMAFEVHLSKVSVLPSPKRLRAGTSKAFSSASPFRFEESLAFYESGHSLKGKTKGVEEISTLLK
jgi:hypothetical protein